jgi:hypothetical protein
MLTLNQKVTRLLIAFIMMAGGCALAAASLSAPTPPRGADANVVDFKQSAWPGVVSKAGGLAGTEPWGTWSVGSAVALQFFAPLPEKFAVHLVAQAFGPNVGKEFVARVGDSAARFTLGAAPEERVLEFGNPTLSRTIEIEIPAPTSPKALGMNGDARTLGIGLVELRIAPVGDAAVQKRQRFDAKGVYDSVDCGQWTLNSDGTWDGGANARVGSMTFHNTLHLTMNGFSENGVDAAAALLKKCAKR